MANAPRTLSLKEHSAEYAASQAIEVMGQGGIVAFPTETVYGLAIRGDSPEVRERVYDLKKREPNQQLARYVASQDQVKASGIPMTIRAKRLMNAFWPGPLTIVVEDSAGVTHGFRASSHPVAALMGSHEDYPVFGTSANLSGTPPIADAATIYTTLGDGLDLIIDEGQTLERQASTVVLLPSRGGFQLLREGFVDKAMIHSELAMKICLVCTGNTCRSPLAEVMLTAKIQDLQLGNAEAIEYEISSAGTSAGSSMAASRYSQAVAQERNLDLSHHSSQAISARQLESCDLILTMTKRHRDMLVNVLPECKDRVRTLAGTHRDIADPFGGDLETYRHCAEDIENELNALLEEL